MIVDSSAIVAIVWAESDAEQFINAIVGSGDATMSAGNYLETSIVIDRDRDPAHGPVRETRGSPAR